MQKTKLGRALVWVFGLNLVCVGTIFAGDIRAVYGDFPLRGQTWLFGKGINNNIYPSFSKSVPTHLIMATFPPDASAGGVIELQWAVFTGLNFKSTGHLLNEAWKQFQNNKVSIRFNVWVELMASGQEAVLALTYRSAPDTVWSCDSTFYSLPQYTKKYVSFWNEANYTMDTVEWKGNTDPKKWLWHRTKPTAWGETPFNDNKKKTYTTKSNMYDYMDSADVDSIRKYGGKTTRYFKSLRAVIESRGDFVDYCEEDEHGGNGLCYEQIDCATTAQSSLKFWSLHLFPVVKWYPRQFQSGKPLMDSVFVMSTWQARRMRELSLKYADKDGWGKKANSRDVVEAMGGDTLSELPMFAYRKPYYSDSTSCVISVQFVGNSPRVGYIMTSIKDTEDSRFRNFYVDRVPDRIVQVHSHNPQEVKRAILRLYAESASDDKKFGSIYERCGSGWEELDIKIGEEYRFPTPAGRRDFSSPGGTTEVLVMDTGYYEPRYIYNGCPCLPIAGLRNFSASDLRAITYRMPPMCDVASMSNALYVLLEARKYLKNENDIKTLRQRIVQLGTALDVRSNAFVSLTPAQVRNVTAFCPDTWEMNFRDTTHGLPGVPMFRSSYTSDMRIAVDSIKILLGRQK